MCYRLQGLQASTSWYQSSLLLAAWKSPKVARYFSLWGKSSLSVSNCLEPEKGKGRPSKKMAKRTCAYHSEENRDAYQAMSLAGSTHHLLC